MVGYVANKIKSLNYYFIIPYFSLRDDYIATIYAKMRKKRFYISLLNNKIQQGFLLLLIGMMSCGQKKPQLQSSFYYWKTQFSVSSAEKNALDSLQVQKLYVHFFDIDWDEIRNMPIPLAEITWKDSLFPVQKIVPTVFITNRTFEHLSKTEIADFSQKIATKIQHQLQQVSLAASEIQIDCDWTESTQSIYFELLAAIKKAFPNVPISATIRLHQLKYFHRTGVPPVDRGMLMCYNLGDVRKPETQNSILAIEDLKKYVLPPVKYPIPLDIALPIFSWGVVRRNEKTVHLLNDFAITAKNRKFFTEILANQWSCDSSHYENSVYLYKNDLVRVEKVSQETLQMALALLQPFVNESSTLAFYHLSAI